MVQAQDDFELVGAVAQLLRSEGRRRPVWKRLLPAVPLAFALLFAIFAVLSIVFERPAPMLTAAILILIVILCAGGCWLAFRIHQTTKHTTRGAKFREVSRAAMRDRITNVRANAIVAVIFTPLGALVGWLLKSWFGS